ncbi:unnamed protein product, partial [Mesorhabditis belari]|uniref:DNA replication licensing factor MCM3 n=1 Tax=Mesorhabditis belari TaxID=2138241 RepID=A0AAF3FE33_9BILA
MANLPGHLGLVDREVEQRNREFTQEYISFFDDSKSDNRMHKQIEDFCDGLIPRVIVNIDSLREKLPNRADQLLKNFAEEVGCVEAALKEVHHRANDANFDGHYHVGFEGSMGDRHVNPRSLKSNFLGNLVCCEGIVTKCTSVRPKVVSSVHYCPATGKTLERRYTDATDPGSLISSNTYPTQDENKNPLTTEFGLSHYKDHQQFTLQELPECAPAGQLPRNLDVIVDWDLADAVQPGDRVRVIGLYRVMPKKRQGFTDCSFRSLIIANNVQHMSKLASPDLETDDIKRIRKLAKDKDVFDILSRSLAPSIYGHEEVKKGILCLLLGGEEKITASGVRIRGDINVLLIGDPSVAKSQMLRYVLNTAPRAITTTGRGSSGVGLTAAVTTDPDSGERRLEAGAMVLADRGVVCIDEFDKMTDADRTSIHEVMEQGRVTIAKAGIQAQLNARCSVLAAANPVYGRYDPYKSPMENINMQDSLLSRFDLVFVLRDEHDCDRDRNVAEQVLKMHRYRTKGEPDGTVLKMGGAVKTISTKPLDDDAEKGRNDGIYEKDSAWTAVAKGEKVLTIDFVRKFIKMAKNAPTPELGKKARDMIADAYAELRSVESVQEDTERTMIVTVRQLESLIRLSTAVARARLAKEVDPVDVEKAYGLLHFACFKEKPKQKIEWERRHKKKTGEDDDEEGDEEMPEEQEEVISRGKKRGRLNSAGDSQDTTSQEQTQESTASQTATMDVDTTLTQPTPKRVRSEPATIGVGRYKLFKKYARKALDELSASGDFVDEDLVTQKIQELADKDGQGAFEEGEVVAGYEKMGDDNAIMCSEGRICPI